VAGGVHLNAAADGAVHLHADAHATEHVTNLLAAIVWPVGSMRRSAHYRGNIGRLGDTVPLACPFERHARGHGEHRLAPARSRLCRDRRAQGRCGGLDPCPARQRESSAVRQWPFRPVRSRSGTRLQGRSWRRSLPSLRGVEPLQSRRPQLRRPHRRSCSRRRRPAILGAGTPTDRHRAEPHERCDGPSYARR
jgi:hypothetical protein